MPPMLSPSIVTSKSLEQSLESLNRSSHSSFPAWPSNPTNWSKNSGTTAISCATTGCRTATNVEQLTFLLFLKMADEQSRAPFNKPSPIPKNVDWQSLMRLDATSWRRITGMFWSRWASRKGCLVSFSERRRTRSRILRSSPDA